MGPIAPTLAPSPAAVALREQNEPRLGRSPANCSSCLQSALDNRISCSSQVGAPQGLSDGGGGGIREEEVTRGFTSLLPIELSRSQSLMQLML